MARKPVSSAPQLIPWNLKAMERREHHRAQLSLPVRIRWTTPFGQKTEYRETLDVSRGGLLVTCAEPHHTGVPLWVTFPYDDSTPDGQPELLAKVVRVASVLNGKRAEGFREFPGRPGSEEKPDRQVTLGLELDSANHSRHKHNGNGTEERRSGLRIPIGLVIHVRPQEMPWFEEAMSVDVSGTGMKFLSSREYRIGEKLMIGFEHPGSGAWTGACEFACQVLRLEASTQTPALAVTVQRTK